MELPIAIGLFLVSAAGVIYFGSRLAKYGDALAILTGWGRLFVGSILIALATSLPELFINIAAVQEIIPLLPQPNPQLAIGNVLGANMMNMFTLALVALLFGGQRFLRQVAPEQRYLILGAVVMTGTALFFGAVRWSASVWNIGLSSLVILALYVLVMGLVYRTRPSSGDDADASPVSLRYAWLMFGLASLGVIAFAPLLAYSTDKIAVITGIASSTLGILAVSVVTTMPEAASTIAAARLGVTDLGVSGLYGSCVFNITILSVADVFFRRGQVVDYMEPAHLVAGAVAIGLMLVGLLLILARNSVPRLVVALGLTAMLLGYVAGAVTIARLGALEVAGSTVVE